MFTQSYPQEILPFDYSVLDFGLIMNSNYAHEIFLELYKNAPWKPDKIIIYGKENITKRKYVYFGDNKFDYKYSGVSHTSLAYSPVIKKLKSKIEKIVNQNFNSVLLNLYYDGSQGMGWHSDDESTLGSQPMIASLSLGATRRFDLKHKQTKETKHINLESGQLIVMSQKSQSHWKHQIPKQLKIKEPRINLTFRRLIPEPLPTFSSSKNKII